MMKRSLVCALIAVTGLLSPAGAEPTPYGIATPNIEYVKHVPGFQNGVGGRLIGRYFYIQDQNKVTILDVGDPLNPVRLGFVAMPQEWQFSREDIDGNGKILVVPNTASGVNDGTPPSDPTSALSAVYILDVEDKTNPTIISKVGGVGEHTYSCVLDCTWAYGSAGTILDLRDPANPVVAEEGWGDDLQAKSGHDVEEVANGRVMTGTMPLQFVDVRKDPTHPKLLASGTDPDAGFIHGTMWPRNGKDRFLLAAAETTFNLQCRDNSGSFMTWDASKWRETHTFTMIDQIRVRNGTWTDGSPGAQRNCSAHWFDTRPGYRNGGFVAAGFYDHGTRFFKVTSKGKIKEAGFYMTYGGQASAAYWITKEIVYTVDYNRGLDILRFSPP